MADRYPYAYYLNVNASARSEEEEFDEEDVWGVLKERNESTPKTKKPKEVDLSTSPVAGAGAGSVGRMIPRGNNKSSAINEGYKQQSAPVNIPDWSRVYRKSGTTAAEDDDVDVDVDVNVKHGDRKEWIPPHEWIARKLARSQISSFSVCEGAGRTLKGRDLSKVRNAVLSRTGFLE